MCSKPTGSTNALQLDDNNADERSLWRLLPLSATRDRMGTQHCTTSTCELESTMLRAHVQCHNASHRDDRGICCMGWGMYVLQDAHGDESQPANRNRLMPSNDFNLVWDRMWLHKDCTCSGTNATARKGQQLHCSCTAASDSRNSNAGSAGAKWKYASGTIFECGCYTHELDHRSNCHCAGCRDGVTGRLCLTILSIITKDVLKATLGRSHIRCMELKM